MNLVQSLVNGLIWLGTGITCRIDAAGIERVPRQGPLILTINHINSLEVPLLLPQLQPRHLIGLAKIETWNNRVMGWLFDLYHAIPIRRGEVDLGAIHRSLAVLANGEILVVAPEGTRSYDGKLQYGRQGIVLLALRACAPVLPIVHWGGEAFSQNIRQFKRTDFHIRVGKPFFLDSRGEKLVGKLRQAIVDEIMVQMAMLMPESYRGVYKDFPSTSPKYLRFA